MALCTSFSLLFVLSNVVFSGAAQMVPAMYVFGDSLMDVGNNNYLPLSLAKGNMPHNGIDFSGKIPTGRFSNGKNSADFFAQKLGLPTSPPYLSINSKDVASFLNGVSFASGAAGIFDTTGQTFVQIISMTKQVEYYSRVCDQLAQLMGSSASQKHFAESLFVVTIGSVDLFTYFSSVIKSSPPQQYVNLMAQTLKSQLKRIYEHGARKFLVVEVGPLGCTPMQRLQTINQECYEEHNVLVRKFNEALKSMLLELKNEISDFNFSLFHLYPVVQNFINKPTAYGFKEIKAACCGLGPLNAAAPCLPTSDRCSNRRDYIFWDSVHPTEAASNIVANFIFDDSSQYTFPMNIWQLIAM